MEKSEDHKLIYLQINNLHMCDFTIPAKFIIKIDRIPFILSKILQLALHGLQLSLCGPHLPLHALIICISICIPIIHKIF